MAMSFQEHRAVPMESSSVADGIAVRVPVAEAVEIMTSTVDAVQLVSDGEMLTWMRHAFIDAGLVIEPSAAAGLAAIASQTARGSEDRRVATILTGGNLTEEQIRDWLY
jgi:threonine dehydratase